MNKTGEGEILLFDCELYTRWHEKVSLRTIKRWRAEGKGPAFFKLEGRVVYQLSKIVEYERAQQQKSDLLGKG
jgi:hypothetical protein